MTRCVQLLEVRFLTKVTGNEEHKISRAERRGAAREVACWAPELVLVKSMISARGLEGVA